MEVFSSRGRIRSYVLHRVLYPQVHVNGVKKKKKSTAPSQRRNSLMRRLRKRSFSFSPQIPLTAERVGLTFYQPSKPMNQQDEDNNIRSRSCPQCSVAQRTQVRRTTEYAAERQDPDPSGVSGTFIMTLQSYC